jgi:predicted membrane-bound spermidine synthase
MLLYAIVFITGGAVLALELLASRIMTPYFGVSLYIWTGILSITLVALAIGYRAGGWLAASGRAAGAGRLLRLYALLPAVAALAIVGACLIYPHTFRELANASLVAGAFAACMVLLFVPLVATSAMNPLLVAILLERGAIGARGDAGAGRVFFVSTLGSVAGVLLTAFVLIPHASHFAGALLVALALAALALLAALACPLPPPARRTVAATAGLAALLAGLLLWQADAYTQRNGPYAYAGQLWRVEARYNSHFGTVKVLRSEADPRTGRFLRAYFQDGLVQNVLDSTQRSASFYTYALEALARSYRPDMHSALVLGLGGGCGSDAARSHRCRSARGGHRPARTAHRRSAFRLRAGAGCDARPGCAHPCERLRRRLRRHRHRPLSWRRHASAPRHARVLRRRAPLPDRGRNRGAQHVRGPFASRC